MSIASFYNPEKWTLPFWAWGDRYTIVTNRHIGLDIGRFGGKTETVPALVGGKVVRVRWTSSMGVCVVVHGNDGRFYAYCHLANDRPPKEGTTLNAGDRVGRLATGARNTTDIDYPGSAWDGIHLHIVVSNKADAAYTYPKIAGAEFYDPAPIIRNVLSAPASGNSRPFDPEEDELNKEQDMMLRHIFDTLTPGKENVKFDGSAYRVLVETRDAVTPGKEGVKFDGFTYAAAKEARDGVRKMVPVVAEPIPRQGGEMKGSTDLRSFIAWSDQNNIVIQNLMRSVKSDLAKQITESLSAGGATVDPKVISAAIEKALGSGLSGAIATAVREKFAKEPLK